MEDRDDPVWMLNLIKRLTCTLMEADSDLVKESRFNKDLQEQVDDLKESFQNTMNNSMKLSDTILSLQKENEELRQQVEFLRKVGTQAGVVVGTGVTGPYVLVEHV